MNNGITNDEATVIGNFIESMRTKKLQEYLRWLITPQNEAETKLFRDKNLVDAYIEIEKRIPYMTELELMEEINTQLKPFNLSITQ